MDTQTLSLPARETGVHVRAPDAERWRSMVTAPQDRLILFNIRHAGKLIAVTGQYDPKARCFATLALAHHVPVNLFPLAWCDIPDVHSRVVE